MDWRQTQSWLYTVAEFGEFDLHVEYLTPAGGNSGISIRDHTRGRYAIGPGARLRKDPRASRLRDPNPQRREDQVLQRQPLSLRARRFGHEKDSDWNSLDIESRNNMIRIKLNGQEVASHAGDPARPKTGPIGLQLHDRFNVIMFRNIKIRELAKNSSSHRHGGHALTIESRLTMTLKLVILCCLRHPCLRRRSSARWRARSSITPAGHSQEPKSR